MRVEVELEIDHAALRSVVVQAEGEEQQQVLADIIQHKIAALRMGKQILCVLEQTGCVWSDEGHCASMRLKVVSKPSNLGWLKK